MKNFVLLIAGIIDLLANIPYIRDAYRGKTKPNVASWSTWTLVNGIAAVAAFTAGGAFNAVVLGASYFVGSFTILVIGIFRGTRRYTLFDGVCQATAILGVILGQLAHDPNIALGFALAVDVFAVLPTFRHAYSYPQEETWTTYLIAGLVALVTICLASSYSFAALAIPVDYFLANSFLAGVILYRRHKPS